MTADDHRAYGVDGLVHYVKVHARSHTLCDHHHIDFIIVVHGFTKDPVTCIFCIADFKDSP